MQPYKHLKFRFVQISFLYLTIFFVDDSFFNLHKYLMKAILLDSAEVGCKKEMSNAVRLKVEGSSKLVPTLHRPNIVIIVITC